MCPIIEKKPIFSICNEYSQSLAILFRIRTTFQLQHPPTTISFSLSCGQSIQLPLSTFTVSADVFLKLCSGWCPTIIEHFEYVTCHHNPTTHRCRYSMLKQIQPLLRSTGQYIGRQCVHCEWVRDGRFVIVPATFACKNRPPLPSFSRAKDNTTQRHSTTTTTTTTPHDLCSVPH